MLTAITASWLAATYDYDFLGRRSRKTVSGIGTTYVYSGFDPLKETTTAETWEYLFGANIDEVLSARRAGADYFYAADALGSVQQICDSLGFPTARYSYDSWGEATQLDGTLASPFLYAARELSEDTLMYYRFRYYQPRLGRFISEDPLGTERSDNNAFRYVYNNPTSWIDPYGLDAVTSDPRIQQAMYQLWQASGYGRLNTERSAWIVQPPSSTDKPESLQCTITWPWTASNMKEEWKGPVPENLTGLAHTHPDKADPRPSTGGTKQKNKDDYTANYLGKPVYTVTRQGIYKIDPEGKTTQEEPKDWWKKWEDSGKAECECKKGEKK